MDVDRKKSFISHIKRKNVLSLIGWFCCWWWWWWLVAKSCLTLCHPTDCSLPGFPVHGISQARITEVDCHFLLQGIFPTQGSNPHLLHCGQILYPWATKEDLLGDLKLKKKNFVSIKNYLSPSQSFNQLCVEVFFSWALLCLNCSHDKKKNTLWLFGWYAVSYFSIMIQERASVFKCQQDSGAPEKHTASDLNKDQV